MIYHFCPRADWVGAGDPYTAPSLADEKFIHCSARHQVAGVATSVAPGRTDLVLLCIDETGLPVTWEDCYELGEEFPHVYGPIPRTAVTAVLPFPCDSDGSFSLPDPTPAGPTTHGWRPGMIRTIETTLTTAAGAALGWLTGSLFDGLLGSNDIAIAGSVVGGLNGAFGGARRIYGWRTMGGWLAFLLDSSWALVSSAQAVLVNTYNTLHPGSEFSPEYSVRRNRHVFGRGFRLKRTFATTQGNVVSNARLGRDAPMTDRHDLIERHEGLHVWQQRWFGPVFPLTYVIVGTLGAIVGLVFGLFSRERRRRGMRIGKLVETAAYYDNPFEIWAYRRDQRWEVCGAQPVLKWGTFRWETSDDR